MREPKKDIYYGIYLNGSTCERKSIDEIKKIEHIKFYVWAKHVDYRNNPQHPIDWFQYIPIDKEGNPVSITIGDFEIGVGHIDPDTGSYWNGLKRVIRIYDRRKHKLYDHLSESQGIPGIYEEIILLLENVNKLGSYEAYELSIEFKKLKDKYDKLLIENLELKQELNQSKE